MRLDNLEVPRVRVSNNNAEMFLSFTYGTSPEQVARIAREFEAAGFAVAVEQRKFEAFAALQYLLPTALFVYVVKPYTDKFLSKLAEDNYEQLKSALQKLWLRYLAPDRTERTYEVASSPGKLEQSELAMDLSFIANTSDGQFFKLLFKDGVPPSEFLAAVSEFYSLLHEHESDPQLSPIRKACESGRSRSQRILIYESDAGGRLVEVDVRGSSQQKKLVIVELSRR